MSSEMAPKTNTHPECQLRSSKSETVETPMLTTGEKFYTNISKDGFHIGDRNQTLDEYVAELRVRHESVVVMPVATDVHGRIIKNDVAVFVK